MSDGVVVRQAVIGDLEELVAMWTRYIRVHALNPAYRRIELTRWRCAAACFGGTSRRPRAPCSCWRRKKAASTA